ncbi:MAG: biopolymer transporter ExbD [Candidatus Cloacimonetes bacterium]|nr:biopolymer transporter ExbD [Candidatus Cloacimonadota bacterium]MBL7108060.1 biopolymer transporter ExbD [Candidatus Cloacimonadota bacterium]
MAGISASQSHKSSLTGSAFTKRKKKARVMELNITSLIDVLTILLIFLLKNYSSDPQLSTSKDIELPYTTSTERVKTAINISISKKWILLDNKPIIKTQSAIVGKYLDIPELRKVLGKKAMAEKLIAETWKKKGIEGKEFDGTVLLQADKNTPYKMIKKVMYTCGNTEYNNIMLTLVKDDNPHY